VLAAAWCVGPCWSTPLRATSATARVPSMRPYQLPVHRQTCSDVAWFEGNSACYQHSIALFRCVYVRVAPHPSPLPDRSPPPGLRNTQALAATLAEHPDPLADYDYRGDAGALGFPNAGASDVDNSPPHPRAVPPRAPSQRPASAPAVRSSLPPIQRCGRVLFGCEGFVPPRAPHASAPAVRSSLPPIQRCGRVLFGCEGFVPPRTPSQRPASAPAVRSSLPAIQRCGRVLFGCEGFVPPRAPSQRPASAPAVTLQSPSHTATKKWRIVILRFGTAPQKMVLERWTNPKPLQPIWDRAAI
jgi:hypothetical protein